MQDAASFLRDSLRFSHSVAGTVIADAFASRFIEEHTMQRFAPAISHDNTSDAQERDLHLRIRAEFAEMPGLKLTLPQATRLFNIDAAQCERALDRLVASGSLSLARGAFVRAGDGRHAV
jgi:hypothetical protein